MIKCRVFKTDWNDPELHSAVRAFNSFCLDNPDIEVIKIDTITIGADNGDPQIFLYYKEPAATYSHCTGNHMLSDFEEVTVRNFKPGDKVFYKTNCKEYSAEIIKTENFTCIIKIDITGDLIKTNYRYISKQEED